MICANSYRYKNSTTLQSFSMIYWFFHDCPWSVIFHDFPDPENGCTKFHDFPLLSTAGDTVSDWCLKLLNLVLLSTVNTDYSTWRRNSSQHTAVTETPAGSSQLSLRHLLAADNCHWDTCWQQPTVTETPAVWLTLTRQSLHINYKSSSWSETDHYLTQHELCHWTKAEFQTAETQPDSNNHIGHLPIPRKSCDKHLQEWCFNIQHSIKTSALHWELKINYTKLL